MKLKLFQELIASVREGGAILRGEQKPSRVFTNAAEEPLLDLDPHGRTALAYLNDRWAEKYESWDSMDRPTLLYWLRQALLELELYKEPDAGTD